MKDGLVSLTAVTRSPSNTRRNVFGMRALYKLRGHRLVEDATRPATHPHPTLTAQTSGCRYAGCQTCST